MWETRVHCDDHDDNDNTTPEEPVTMIDPAVSSTSLEAAHPEAVDLPLSPFTSAFDFNDQLLNILEVLDGELRKHGVDISTHEDLHAMVRSLSGRYERRSQP
jgi:hypothetical protein